MVLPWDLHLVPVLAGTFMVHFETTLVPGLEKLMKPWKRYLDDTITYIKPDFITDVIDILNKFHQNIKFTYEVDHNGKILTCFGNEMQWKIRNNYFSLKTNNDIYFSLEVFCPYDIGKRYIKDIN